MKHVLFTLSRGQCFCLMVALALFAGNSAQATDGTWTGTTGTWTNSGNWSSGVIAGAASPSTTDPGTATFNANSGTVTVDNGRNVKNILFDGSAGTFTLATGTLVLTSGGSVTLGGTSSSFTGTGITETVSAPIKLEGNYSFVDNSANATNALVISGAVTTAVSGTSILTLDGANSGTNTVSGIISNGTGTLALVKNGAGTWNLAGANTFTGGVTINNGTLSASSTSTTSFGSSGITLGATSGSNNATLLYSSTGAQANAITVSAGSSGTLTIENSLNSNTFSGAIGLNNNLTVDNLTAGKTTTFSGALTENSAALTITKGTGAGIVTFSTGGIAVGSGGLTMVNNGGTLFTVTNGAGSVTGTGALTLNANSTGGITVGAANNTGTITNSGSGSGITTFAGVIGSNVTGVVENSATSTLTLSGANTFTGGLTIANGTVVANVGNVGTTSGAAGASTSAITLGGTGGSNSASLLANSFTVANAINLGTTSGLLTLGNNAGSTAAVYSGAIGLNGNSLTISSLGTGSTSITGGISGTGSLTISNGSTTASTTISTNSVNNAGTITNNGTGTGLATISGGVGSNVTGITENSATSGLTISTNALTTNGTATTLTNSNASGSSLLTLSGGVANTSGNLILNNNSAITNGITVSTGTVNNIGTITNTGTGSGNTLISAVIGSSVAGVIENSATSTLTLSAPNSTGNLFAGGLTILSGTVISSVNNASEFGTGTITLGASSGSANATLIDNTDVIAPANPISIASGNTGTATLEATAGSTNGLSGAITLNSHDLTVTSAIAGFGLTGGVTGTGNLNITDANGGTTSFTTTSVNMAGNILNNGTGTGVTAFSTVVGGNVVNVTENSVTSALSLSAANTFTGNLFIKAGTANLTNATAASTGTIMLGDSSGSSNSTLNLNVSTTFGNVVSVISGNTGTATIGSTVGSNVILSGAVLLNSHDLTVGDILGGGALTLTGGVTGTGNLTINSGASGVTKFTTAAINNNGTITNLGSSTGTTTISSALGANVGLVTENSSTSALVLSGNNSAWTNNLLVSSGLVQLGSSAVNAVSANNTVTVNSGGTFDLNTATVHVAGLNDVSGSGGTVTNSGAASTGLYLDGSGTYSYNGAITSATSNDLTILKNGTGTQTLGGTNTYTGQTQVNAGKLILTGSLASSGVLVGNTTASAILAGTGTITGSLTTSSSGTKIAYIAPGVNTTGTRGDFGSVGTLNVGSLSFTVGSGSNFDYDLNTSTSAGGTNNDLIAMGGGTLTIGGTGIVFNFNQLSSLTTGAAYTLINGAGSISGFSPSDFSATGIGSDTATFSMSGGSLLVTFNTPVVGSTNYYFTGSNSGTFTDAGNYYTATTGGTQQATALSATSNVYLNATSPTPTNTPDTLNSAATINTLTFLTGGTSLAGTGTLTVAASSGVGITDSATGGTTETISPAVVLGSNQTWSVANSSNTLNDTGSISGAQSLVITGTGTVKLGGANTFQGLTVGTASDTPTVLLTNGTSGSATGTTTLTVNSGATIGGTGTSSGTSFSVSGTGTTTATRANVLVGLVSATDMSVNTTLALKGTAASTIQDANLTFNINSAIAGGNGTNPTNSGTELSVGNTAITFGSGMQSTTLTLNVVGTTAVIAQNTPYVLFAGTAVGTSAATSQYSGLSFGSSTGSLSGGLITPILNSSFGGSGNLTLSMSSGAAGYYGSSSYLFLYQNTTTGVDDIEVEVVPEPSTWAMIIGGLAVLIFWQRRKNKLS